MFEKINVYEIALLTSREVNIKWAEGPIMKGRCMLHITQGPI